MDEKIIELITEDNFDIEASKIVENEVSTEDLGQTINIEEEIKVVEVEATEEIEIEIEEAVGWISGDGTKHYNLAGRDEPDQHPISAIIGLRSELDNIEALQTVYSDKKQQADYYLWRQDEEHPLPANPYGLFVSIYPETNNIHICDGTNDVFGVTVSEAAFVGNQEYVQAEGGTKTGRDGNYCLVAHSGLVGVRRMPSVVVGDYVVPNSRGEAEKSNGDYGYLVTAVSDVNGLHAIISLNSPSTLAKKTVDSVEDLSGRMGTAEYNITSVTNVANSAYALAKDAKENAEVNSEYIEEKIEEVLGRMDAVDGVVGNLSESVNNASTNAALAKTIAESAVSSAEAIRSEAVKSANEAISSVKDLTEDLAPITEWVDPNNPENTGAQYYTTYIENGINTKVDIETFDSKTEDAFNAIERNAKSIMSLMATIDKYVVGEYSQAYNLTLEQATSTLSDEMVYVPTIIHTESYGSYTQEFSLGYYYAWDGEKWIPSQSTAVGFSSTYFGGSEQTPYWVVTISDVTYNNIIYDLGGLYKWENGVWVKVASIADNTLSRAVSAIKQTANSISMDITNIKGDVASHQQWLDDNSANIQSVVTWKSDVEKDVGSIATIKQTADDAGASIAQVVEAVGADGKVTSASITTSIIDDESSIALLADNITLDADHINFTAEDYGVIANNIGLSGYVTLTNLATEGETTIHGGNIETGTITAEQINTTDLQAEVIQSSNYTSSIQTWDSVENPPYTFTYADDGKTITRCNADTSFKGTIIIPEGVTKISDSAFVNCASFTGIVIPNSVTAINNWAFGRCSSLTNVIIPDSVKYLGEAAFVHCTGLVSATLPKHLTAIPHYLFQECHRLTNITIPDSVTSIGHLAFYHCPLKSITIPKSVTSIDYHAFGYCRSLETIYCEATVKPSGWNTKWAYSGSASDSTNTEEHTVYWYSETPPTDTSNKYWHSGGTGFKISSQTGDNLIDSPYFQVSQEGRVVAASADITGAITATSLKIGNQDWNDAVDERINNGTYFEVDSKTGNIVLAAGKKIYLGSDQLEIDTTNFKLTKGGAVEMTGTITAKNGQIGDFFISSNGWLYNNLTSLDPETANTGCFMSTEGMLFKDQTLKYFKATSDGVETQQISFYYYPDSNPANKKIPGKIFTGDEGVVSAGMGIVSYDSDIYLGCMVRYENGEYSGVNPSTGIQMNSNEGRLEGTWKNASGVVIVSDQNKKHSIQLQPEIYSQVFDGLKPSIFKYNDGQSDRYHTGLIAQDVEQAVLDTGLTTKEFAAICYDTDENGNKTDYGIRYSELVSMCVYEIQKLKAKVVELEDKLATIQ